MFLHTTVPGAVTPNTGKRWIQVLAVEAAGVLAASVAVFLATPPAPRRPQLNPIVFNLVRAEGNEYVVSPQRVLELPPRYGDFDLNATIEMSPETELDVVFHKVSEWDQQGDQHVRPFHARFDVLRLSTRGEGRPFLTSEEALFDDGTAGVRLQPGRPLTLLLQARGRHVRANIAGVEVPWFETRDDHGNLALVARGGSVVVKRLWIKPWASPSRLLPVGWGAIVGGVLGLLLLLVRPPPPRLLLAVLVVVAGGLLARVVTCAEYLVAAEPSTQSILVAGLCFLPFSVLVVLPGPRVAWRVVAGVGMALLALEYAARAERNHLQAFEDTRLDLYFGQQSGSAPFDALAQRLSNNRGIHYPLPGLGEAARYDVLFLGGGLLFDSGDRHSMAGLDRNVVSQVAGHLRNRLGGKRNVQAAALPTLAPNCYQQYLLAERFYVQAFRPRVLVFGLWDTETQPALYMPARQLEAALPGADAPGWSVLVGLWLRARREPVPPGGLEDLRQTLEDVVQLCAALQSRLVVVLDKSTDPDRAAVAREFVKRKQGGVSLVEGFDISATPGVYPIQQLVGVTEKWLGN